VTNLRVQLLSLVLDEQSLDQRQRLFDQVDLVVRWHRQTLARFTAFAARLSRLSEEDRRAVRGELDLDFLKTAAKAVRGTYNVRRFQVDAFFRRVERLVDAVLRYPSGVVIETKESDDFSACRIRNLLLTITLEWRERCYLDIAALAELALDTVAAYVTLCITLSDPALDQPRVYEALGLSADHCRKTAAAFLPLLRGITSYWSC
jgi:hypothetical protein